MPDAFSKHVTPNQTPQRERASHRQVKNNAGGYTFKVGDKERLDRFLTLGTEGGTYYVNERKLTRDNAAFVNSLAESSRSELIDQTLAISEAGRAPRNNAALFALAATSLSDDVRYRQRALDVLPRIARTGSHFETWIKYVRMYRGWGPQLVKAAQRWYLSKEPDQLAYQLLKYKSRDGWSHRDILRLCGRKSVGDYISPQHDALFKYVMKDEFDVNHVPALVSVAAAAHSTTNVREWVRLIKMNRSLSHEMLPSEALAEKDVWMALLEGGNIPLNALVTNLSRLTRLGIIAPLSAGSSLVTSKLTDQEYILKSRIHPIKVLMAIRAYERGRAIKGKTSWTPVQPVMDALDDMFYKSFGTVTPSGKRTAIAIDVSGSMADPNFTPMHTKLYEDTGLTARDIAACMALIVMKTEPEYAVVGFSGGYGRSGIEPLNISPRMRLDDVVRAMGQVYAGGTDCSLPMIWAMENNFAVDTFQISTDNETHGGRMHPHQALKEYRRRSGINARMQVIAATATDFTIADPLDPGTLDVAGFDAAVPNLLSAHARGDI